MQLLIKNTHFRDNIIFIAISLIAFSMKPALAQEQANPYNPINFTQALNMQRGSLSPNSPNAFYFNEDDACKLMQEMNGWSKEACRMIDSVIISASPGIDTLIVEKPNSEGYVKFDDWEGADAKEEIASIWSELVQGTSVQSEKLGQNISAEKWVVYPTLNKEKSYLYYAFLLNWDNEKVINIKATLFDRNGYVPFRIVPDKADYSEYELRRIVETTLASYAPYKEQAYFNFKDGDKIAAAGAIGVLATLVGVKYGKALATGFMAIALVLLKKMWLLIFLPFIFLKKFFSKKKDD